jgi:hypothetical protein
MYSLLYHTLTSDLRQVVGSIRSGSLASIREWLA